MTDTGTKIERARTGAVCRIGSWLGAVGVEYSVSGAPASDLTVRARTGDNIQIKMAGDGEDLSLVPADRLIVKVKEIVSRDLHQALTAFHGVTERAGYGSPIPMYRGEKPGRRLNMSDDFDGVSMRHNEFRKSPNPTDEELLRYEKVQKRAVRRFMDHDRNREMCGRNCLSAGDLMTYARVWTCIYLALYQDRGNGGKDNPMRLHAYLRQRFAQFAGLLGRRERCILPSADTVQAALSAENNFYYAVIEMSEDTDLVEIGPAYVPYTEEEDLEWVARNRKIDVSSADARRASASSLLAENLSLLSHDKMLQVLNDAAGNEYLDAVARREAVRQVKLHARYCIGCGGAPDNKPVRKVKPEKAAPAAKVWTRAMVLGAEMYPEHYQRFLANLPPTKTCPTCKINKPCSEFSSRLVNGKDVVKGKKPKFYLQSRCRTCRRVSNTT